MAFFYLKLSLGIGAIILMLLLWVEFLRRFRPYLVAGPRVLALFFVFLLINFGIYLLLCSIFLQLDPLELMLLKDWDISGNGKEISIPMTVQPILIAVMYFGTGSMPIKVGKVEFGFYDKILGYIESLLPPQTEKPDHSTVRKALDQYEGYRALLDKVNELRAMADVNDRWDSLKSEWTKSSIEPLSAELDELASLLTKFDEGESRERIENDLRTKLDSETVLLRKRVFEYVYKFIAENGKTPGDIEKFFTQGLGYSDPKLKHLKKRPASRMERALVLSAAFGIFFGPIYALAREGAPSIEYAIIGAFALGVFGTILSMTVQKAGRNIVGFIFGGAMAGVAAQVVWYLARYFILDLSLPEYRTLVFGSVIGIVTALYLFAFRFYRFNVLGKLANSPWCLYSSIAIAGAVSLPLAVFLLQIENYQPSFGIIASQFAIGAVTAIGVAFGTDIFSVETREDRLERTN